MASPSVRSQRHSPPPVRSLRLGSKVGRLPLALRRLTAWTLEVSFVAISAFVPYQVGAIANEWHQGELVPLNPMLAATEETIARTLAIPISERHSAVAPLTNLFWSIAVLAPVVVAGSQLYRLGKTGQTLPKQWLRIRVVTATGEPPGLSGALMREGVGRWGIPLGLAYLIWRYSGAFPGLGILASLSGIFLLGEGMSAQFQRQRRAFHDRLAGTYVLDLARGQRSAHTVVSPMSYHSTPMRVETAEVLTEGDGAVTAIVLTPQSRWGRQGLWGWMRRHPGLTLIIVALGGMGLVLGTFVGTQVYIQDQANWRESREQDDRLFIALVDKLSPPSNNSVAERQATILTLGTIRDARAIPLLVDLLAQEENPTLIETLQQALVTTGPEALEPLRRLNQSLRNEIASLNAGNNQRERNLVLLQQRATQRAIAKILTIYSGDVEGANLDRVDLSQTTARPAAFSLVLDQADLGGVNFRSALLAGASLKGSRFYSTGPDGRLQTYDDAIADFSGAELKEADLTGAMLHQVRLSHTNLIRSILDRANLSQANLEGANLSSARLIKANLQQAVLKGASLTGADLSDADLSNTNLQEARLGQVSAVGTNFQGADMPRSDWQGSNVSRAMLRRANLRQANFNGARLVGADLSQAHLQNASFQGADLSAVDLRGANLAQADFQGAILASLEPSGSDEFIALSPQAGYEGLLRGVNFNPVKNLDERQLSYICDQGGIHDKCVPAAETPTE